MVGAAAGGADLPPHQIRQVSIAADDLSTPLPLALVGFAHAVKSIAQNPRIR